MSQQPTTETELVRKFEQLIRRTAMKIAHELRLRVSVEDLMQAGTIGLIEAYRRFDPSVGAPFEAWAYFRIKGAMIDSIGSMTGCSRAQVRVLRRVQAMHEVQESLADTFEGRDAPEDDAAYLEQAMGSVAMIGTLTELASSADDEGGAEDTEGRSPFRADPEQVLRRQQMHQLLTDAIDELPDDEAELMRAHYFGGERLADAGERLGYSRSWASRLHARALNRVRAKVEAATRAVDLKNLRPSPQQSRRPSDTGSSSYPSRSPR